MANTYLSANMNLVIPVPNVDPGPDWANNLNASLTIIDSHNHTSGSGVPIPPGGLDINSSLPMNNNILQQTQAVNLQPQVSDAAINSIYEKGVDLYYRDGSGNAIRITQSGAVAGAAGTITGLPSGTASASYAASTGTFVFQQATSTAANADIGSVILRYPGSYPSPSGNYIMISPPTSLATGYQLFLPPALPLGQQFMTLDNLGNIAAPWIVDNSTLNINGGFLVQVKPGGITGTQISNNINLPGTLVTADNYPIVVSNANYGSSLSLLFGAVNSDGTALFGQGFTSSQHSTGVYGVTYNTAMQGGSNGIFFTTLSTGPLAASLSSQSTGGFTVAFAGNQAFCFLVVGTIP
jgi:hypothetical protein